MGSQSIDTLIAYSARHTYYCDVSIGFNLITRSPVELVHVMFVYENAGEFEMRDPDDSSDSETEASSFVDGQDLCLPALRYLRQCCEIIASMYHMPGCPVFAGAHRSV